MNENDLTELIGRLNDIHSQLNAALGFVLTVVNLLADGQTSARIARAHSNGTELPGRSPRRSSIAIASAESGLQ